MNGEKAIQKGAFSYSNGIIILNDCEVDERKLLVYYFYIKLKKLMAI